MHPSAHLEDPQDVVLLRGNLLLDLLEGLQDVVLLQGNPLLDLLDNLLGLLIRCPALRPQLQGLSLVFLQSNTL